MTVIVNQGTNHWVQESTIELGLSTNTVVDNQRVRVTLRQEMRPNLMSCTAYSAQPEPYGQQLQVEPDGGSFTSTVVKDASGKSTTTSTRRGGLYLQLDGSLMRALSCVNGAQVYTYTYDGLATVRVISAFSAAPWMGSQTYMTMQTGTTPYVGNTYAVYAFAAAGDTLTALVPTA